MSGIYRLIDGIIRLINVNVNATVNVNVKRKRERERQGQVPIQGNPRPKASRGHKRPSGHTRTRAAPVAVFAPVPSTKY